MMEHCAIWSNGKCGLNLVQGQHSVRDCIPVCPYPGGPVLIQNPPPPTMKQVVTFAQALLTGKRVSQEVMNERLKVCDSCIYLRHGDKGAWCGQCGCGVSSDAKILRNLAAFEENLPAWGCKHTQRSAGKGWKI